MKVSGLAAAVAFAAVSMTSNAADAATLSVIGGEATVLPGNFSRNTPEYLALAGGVGSIGDAISVFTPASKAPDNGLFITGKARVTVTYLGREAGFKNTFVFDGSTVFSTMDAKVGDTAGVFDFSDGFVPFSFFSKGFDTVANDGVATTGVRLAFSDVFNGSRSILAFFDDRTSDIDYDDMVVRVDVAAIPLPTTAVLFISGLAGLGFVGRRRKTAA